MSDDKLDDRDRNPRGVRALELIAEYEGSRKKIEVELSGS